VEISFSLSVLIIAQVFDFVKRFFYFFLRFFSWGFSVSLPLTIIIIAENSEIARWDFVQKIRIIFTIFKPVFMQLV